MKYIFGSQFQMIHIPNNTIPSLVPTLSLSNAGTFQDTSKFIFNFQGSLNTFKPYTKLVVSKVCTPSVQMRLSVSTVKTYLTV